jgi:SecD/SecF fusion protein
VIQISVKDILKGLSNNSKKVFNKSLADATANEGNQNYIDAFFEAFEANSKEPLN